MKSLFILTILFIMACGISKAPTPPTTISSVQTDTTLNVGVAIKFINEYASHCSPESNSANDTSWIRKHPLLSESFKTSYYQLLDSVNKKDPELGLGFDPIFNAQDFPDKGFSLFSSDNNTGLVTVNGVDWPEFILVIKLVQSGGKTLVDGAGIINIPPNKRAKN